MIEYKFMLNDSEKINFVVEHKCSKILIRLIRNADDTIREKNNYQDISKSTVGREIGISKSYIKYSGLYEFRLIDYDDEPVGAVVKYLGQTKQLDIETKRLKNSFFKINICSDILLNENYDDLFLTDGRVKFVLPKMRKTQEGKFEICIMKKNITGHKIVVDSKWEKCFGNLEYIIS